MKHRQPSEACIPANSLRVTVLCVTALAMSAVCRAQEKATDRNEENIVVSGNRRLISAGQQKFDELGNELV